MSPRQPRPGGNGEAAPGAPLKVRLRFRRRHGSGREEQAVEELDAYEGEERPRGRRAAGWGNGTLTDSEAFGNNRREKGRSRMVPKDFGLAEGEPSRTEVLRAGRRRYERLRVSRKEKRAEPSPPDFIRTASADSFRRGPGRGARVPGASFFRLRFVQALLLRPQAVLPLHVLKCTLHMPRSTG